MKVRFKQISKDFDKRIAYTVIGSGVNIGFDELQNKYCMGYETKELGFIDAELLEVTEDENDILAVDVIIEIYKNN